MGIENPELFAAEEWYSATYRDGSQRSYEIVIVRSHMHELGYESMELANIYSDGETQPPDELWERVRREVALLSMSDRKPYEPASTSTFRGDEG